MDVRHRGRIRYRRVSIQERGIQYVGGNPGMRRGPSCKIVDEYRGGRLTGSFARQYRSGEGYVRHGYSDRGTGFGVGAASDLAIAVVAARPG